MLMRSITTTPIPSTRTSGLIRQYVAECMNRRRSLIGLVLHLTHVKEA